MKSKILRKLLSEEFAVSPTDFESSNLEIPAYARATCTESLNALLSSTKTESSAPINGYK